MSYKIESLSEAYVSWDNKLQCEILFSRFSLSDQNGALWDDKWSKKR